MTDYWQYHDPEEDWREEVLKESAEIARAEEEAKPGPKAVRSKDHRLGRSRRQKMARLSRAKNRAKKRKKRGKK